MTGPEPETDSAASPSASRAAATARTTWQRRAARAAGWAVGVVAALVGCALLILGVALTVAYPNLPDIGALTDYRPKLPLRVYSSDGVLLGEYGEERRNFMPISTPSEE